ncbi:MAG TPA: metalloregulator ArsR/SmtB family transcription factor [Rubricoccaceae bacterium]
MPDTTTAPCPTDETLVAWARALAHPARLQILRTLAERGACVCGQIVDVLPLAQSTVSQHLKVLKEAGLVCGDVDGPRTCYCIDAEAVAQARAAFDGLFGALAASSGCSC